jgi:hypothetical protein
MNTYRVDRVNSRRVPCGMNSIRYIGDNAKEAHKVFDQLEPRLGFMEPTQPCLRRDFLCLERRGLRHQKSERTQMKTLILHETYIGTQFPCALEYGDNSGLIDNEERQLDAWVLDLIREAEESYDIFRPCASLQVR